MKLRPALASALLAAGLPAIAQAAIAQSASPLPVSAETAPRAEARHADWTEILQAYILPTADGINLFDYAALKDNAGDRARLDAYIERIANQDWENLPREEQFVSWANLYNAVTIRHIIERYPVKSIRSGYITGPWKDEGVEVAGRGFVSLDEMEHGILRQDWDEPRIHYMVNCASIGCPNLRATAWEATPTLDAELDAAARAFINHPRGVTIRRNGGLKVSRIYKWFIEDFGDSEEGVIEHLLEFAEPELVEGINIERDIERHQYDWDLNDTEN
jgi:hypothetical protein